MTRETFQITSATREQTPAMLGILGPSSSGKTFSALRLATGMQRVTGGKIGVLDTEGRRALHYADAFRFEHLDLRAPFGSLRYLAAVEALADADCRTIVIDSMSHEHEGEGGMLEQAGMTPDSGQLPFYVWAKPKAARRRMVNRFAQMRVNLIFCFRAQLKAKPPPPGSKDMETRGWQPIGDERFIFELLANFLLEPGCKGVPTKSSPISEQQKVIKLPGQFEALAGKLLTEETGETIARWCAGGVAPPKRDRIAEMLAAYETCATAEVLESLEAERAKIWPRLPPEGKEGLKRASDAAKARLAAPTAEPSDADEGP